MSLTPPDPLPPFGKGLGRSHNRKAGICSGVMRWRATTDYQILVIMEHVKPIVMSL